MKSQTLVLGALALAAAVFANPLPQMGGMSGCGGMMKMQHEKQAGPKPIAATLVKGVQVATIVIDGGKYTPSVISVKKGVPVVLTFKGGKQLGCGGTVVFKSLKMSKDVATGKSVNFKFTPKKVGAIAFTCGMGMYDGKVVVQ